MFQNMERIEQEEKMKDFVQYFNINQERKERVHIYTEIRANKGMFHGVHIIIEKKIYQKTKNNDTDY